MSTQHKQRRLPEGVAPILVSIPNASMMIDRCVATIYALIGGKKIRAVKSDGRTLVVVESLHEYVASLEEAKIAPPKKRLPLPLRTAATAPPRKRKPQRFRERAPPALPSPATSSASS